MRHLFIINPAAGKGRGLELIPEIKSLCETKGLDYTIEITKYPGHATEIASAYSKAEVLRIYSVGGDGTLNEVLNGMAGSGCSLAGVPCGSGNDFIRSITGPELPKDLIRSAIEGEERLIDYARANDKYFVNITSVGFDAEVVYQCGHYKRLPLITGEFAYVLGILTAILFCRNHNLTIKIDDMVIRKKTLLAAVGNGRYYGGGMLAVPEAVIDDGLFDVCHVEEMKRHSIFRLFPKFMKGLHGSLKEVHFYRGRRVEITADKPIPMNLDGEVTLVDKVIFELFPKGLPFVFPAQ